MLRKIIICSLFFSMLFIVLSPVYAEDSVKQFIVFGTASVGGAYYPLGVGMSSVINETVSYIRANAQVTGGATANMELLRTGEVDIGFESGGAGILANRGEGNYEEAYPIQALYQFSPVSYAIVTLDKTGIKSIYDLEGKTVNSGPVGSGTNQTVADIFDIHGVSYKPSHLGFDNSLEALVDGLIDATIISAAPPAPALEGISNKKPVLVTIDEEIAKKAIKNDSRFKIFTLMDNTPEHYKWLDSPVPTFTCMARAWGRSALSEGVVYDIVKAIFENKERVARIHSAGKIIEPFTKEYADLLGITVHPGAIKYYKEIGVWE